MSDEKPQATSANVAYPNLKPFQKGWKGGPGNPFSKQVAAMRAAIYSCCTPADVRDVLMAMLAFAKGGNVPAAKLFLAYAVGQPPTMFGEDGDESGRPVVKIVLLGGDQQLVSVGGNGNGSGNGNGTGAAASE